MEKVTITKVSRKPMETNGKKWTSLGLLTQEHGEKWLSGFANKENADWEPGSVVEIEIKTVKKGEKTYLNFETPKKEDKNNDLLQKLLTKVGALHNDILIIKDHVVPKKKPVIVDDGAYPQVGEEGDLEEEF